MTAVLRRRAVRWGLVAALLAVALVGSGLILRGEYREAVDGTPRVAVEVPLGSWRPMDFGKDKKPVVAQARVTQLRRLDSLTSEYGDVQRPATGGVYVLAVVEARLTSGPDLLAPSTVLVDDRGRQWGDADVYGDFTELGGLPKSFEIDKAGLGKDGVVTYGTVFEVPRDASGLGVFIDPYDHNYLYR